MDYNLNILTIYNWVEYASSDFYSSHMFQQRISEACEI